MSIGSPISLFTTRALCHALKKAGNIATPSEAEQVLSYLATDCQLNDLDGLYLICPEASSVPMQQIEVWHEADSQPPTSRIFFVSGDEQERKWLDLMLLNMEQTVAPSASWLTLLRWVNIHFRASATRLSFALRHLSVHLQIRNFNWAAV